MLSKRRKEKLCANPKYNQAKVLIEYVVSVCVSTKLGLFFALLFAHPFSLSHFLPRRSDQNLWACLWMTSLRKIVYYFSEKLWFLEIYLFCSFALYSSRLFLFFFLLNCSNQRRFISTFRYHRRHKFPLSLLLFYIGQRWHILLIACLFHRTPFHPQSFFHITWMRQCARDWLKV